MVFMISPEERSKKPYATPVQLVSCRGMTDATVRDLTNGIKRAMVERNMKVRGNAHRKCIKK